LTLTDSFVVMVQIRCSVPYSNMGSYEPMLL